MPCNRHNRVRPTAGQFPNVCVLYFLLWGHSNSADSSSNFVAVNELRLKIQGFLTGEDGPTAIEYAMLAALIVIVCVLAVDAVGTKLNVSFTNSANSINAATGS